MWLNLNSHCGYNISDLKRKSNLAHFLRLKSSQHCPHLQLNVGEVKENGKTGVVYRKGDRKDGKDEEGDIGSGLPPPSKNIESYIHILQFQKKNACAKLLFFGPSCTGICCVSFHHSSMGVDLHKKWGGRGQNRNRMPIWGIRTVVTKTSIKRIPWSLSI